MICQCHDLIHYYYYLMFLKTLGKNVFKNLWIRSSKIWQADIKKNKTKLELLTDIDLLLMVEKGIRGGLCCSINRYAKANNKYMKNYDKN